MPIAILMCPNSISHRCINGSYHLQYSTPHPKARLTWLLCQISTCKIYHGNFLFWHKLSLSSRLDRMRSVVLWFVTVTQLYKYMYIQMEWYSYRKVFHLVIAGSSTLPWNIYSWRTHGILKFSRPIFLWYKMQYWIL